MTIPSTNVPGGLAHGPASNSGIATDYAKAIDLCASTVEVPATPQQKKWGATSATVPTALARPPSTRNRSARALASGVTPLMGSSIAGALHRRAMGGRRRRRTTTSSYSGRAFQAVRFRGSLWRARRLARCQRRQLPQRAWLPRSGQGGAVANDPVMPQGRKVRTPTNANSFLGLDVLLLPSEYPEWVQRLQRLSLTLPDSTFLPGPGQANPDRQEPRVLRSAARRRPGSTRNGVN
jgi:hypothetical protein